VAEVRLDGPLSEHERRRDLAVRLPICDQHRDAALRRRQSLGACAPADVSKLPARLRRPPCCADRLEVGERGPHGFAGLALLPCAPPDDAEREQRAGAAERIAGGGVALDRPFEQRQGPVDVALGGCDESAASDSGGKHGLAAEAGRVRLPRVEDGDRLIDASQLKERLDVVGAPRGQVRFT
jgi:hypothetical protein